MEIDKGEKTEIEQDGTKKDHGEKTEVEQDGMQTNQGEKTEIEQEKPKKLTKQERKALRERNYQKRECDVVDCSTTVYVGNFPRKCSTKDLKKFFSLCGEIEEVVHPKEKIEGKWVPFGWAFIRFKTSEGAKLARMGTGAKVHGRRITIQKRKKAVERPPLRGGKSVFVKNLSYEATEEDIREFFEQAGKVESIKILKRKRKNESLGLAFVDFWDSEGARKSLEVLDGKLFMDRVIRISSSFIKPGTKPPKTCKTVRIKNLPMGTKREQVMDLLEERVGYCHVRMTRGNRSCHVDLMSHQQMLALLQLYLEIEGKRVKVVYCIGQEKRYVNPVWAVRESVVLLEPVPLGVTEEELLKEVKKDLRGIKYLVLEPGKESNRAHVIFKHPGYVPVALTKMVVKIRGREVNVRKWQPHEEVVKEVKKPTKVFGCRVNKLPKKLTKKRFLNMAEKLIGEREFSLIWELNPKRKRFSGTVELIFENVEDARFAKEAFEEYVIPGTCLGLKVFISERQSDGAWTDKIEDLDEIRGLQRQSENSKKRTLQEGEESSSKRLKQDETTDMEVDQQSSEMREKKESSSSEKAQEELADKQETAKLQGKEEISEKWKEEESSEKQGKEQPAKILKEQQSSGMREKEAPA